MSIRSVLKNFFTTGSRPNQAQFSDLIDSCVSLAESNNGNITLTGGVVVGNTLVPALPGAIRWTGTNFEFHTGTAFQPLNLAGGAISNPQDIGNVRIGSNLTGNIATFAHSSKYNVTDFAFGQSPTGTAIINGGTNSILFQNRAGGGITNVMTIQNNKAIINTDLAVNNLLIVGIPPTVPIPPAIPAGTVLAVYGEAQKLSGGAWSVMSDVRVKKDISDFSEGLEKLVQINPVLFKYKGFEHIEGGDVEQVGVLAHEVRSIFPYMVNEVKTKLSADDAEETDLLTFNSSSLQFVIVNAIKELNTRLDLIEKSLAKDKNKNGKSTTDSNN